MTSLQVEIRNWHCLHPAHWVCANTPALRNLDLDFGASQREGSGECCEDGKLFFSKLLSQETTTHQLPKLKTLRVANVCLMSAGNLLPTLLKLENLEHLQLIICLDVYPLLQSLGSLHLSLSSLCIEDCKTDSWDSDYGVDDFIRSLQSLKRIMLRFYGVAASDVFDWSSLRQHATSIECLRIEDTDVSNGPPDQPIYGAQPFIRAPNLEQLALSSLDIEDGEWQLLDWSPHKNESKRELLLHVSGL